MDNSGPWSLETFTQQSIDLLNATKGLNTEEAAIYREWIYRTMEHVRNRSDRQLFGQRDGSNASVSFFAEGGKIPAQAQQCIQQIETLNKIEVALLESLEGISGFTDQVTEGRFNAKEQIHIRLHWKNDGKGDPENIVAEPTMGPSTYRRMAAQKIQDLRALGPISQLKTLESERSSLEETLQPSGKLVEIYALTRKILFLKYREQLIKGLKKSIEGLTKEEDDGISEWLESIAA